MQALDEILQQAQSEIKKINDLQNLEHFRVSYLGKKGLLTALLKELGKLPVEQRKEAGKRINEVKDQIQRLIAQCTQVLEQTAIEQQLTSESIDITLSGRTCGIGGTHPITQVMDELKDIFSHMGYVFLEGPEIEDDYHNFTALNVPPLHPARAMQDTFYFPDGSLLRSQMSPVQIHAMKSQPPPIRMAALGRVYRRDFDITHTPMFHQMECLLVGENVSLSDLKGLLTYFLHTLFSPKTAIRFRPSYFPFTEPSAEVDISCLNCHAQGCRICKHTGWLEILGCGMVHPNVLEGVGIDIEHYSGFAFGLGIDRLALLKYGISDLRTLFENDLRFLKQF